MDKTEQLRELLNQTKSDSNFTVDGKATALHLLHTLIRNDELVRRFNEYFNNGYNFGYFLIQSQRLEITLAGIIDSAEKLRSRTSKTHERKINLNVPLGSLIQELNKYIQGESVFSPLRDFNKYRKKIVHCLSTDFSRNLIEIEDSIGTEYPPQKIEEVHNILLEVSRRISQKLVDIMEDGLVAKNFGKRLGFFLFENSRLSSLEFSIL